MCTRQPNCAGTLRTVLFVSGWVLCVHPSYYARYIGLHVVVIDEIYSAVSDNMLDLCVSNSQCISSLKFLSMGQVTTHKRNQFPDSLTG